LRRIRREEHGTGADEARSGVVAGEHQQEAEAEQLLLAQPLAFDLGREECAHQIVARDAATLGQQLREELVALPERVDVVLRPLDLEERVGPAPERVDVLVGHADHLADHHAREDGGVLVLQVTTSAGGDAVDEVACDAAGQGLDLRHPLRGERS
jgi:hypothetical protein